jgi:ligand-binding sensor domain-containing protein
LPQSSIKSIVQDKYGFIWLSTENGIVRYDGNQFSAFNSATTKLNGSRFTEILGTLKKDSLFCYNEGFKEQPLIIKISIQISNLNLEAKPERINDIHLGKNRYQ